MTKQVLLASITPFVLMSLTPVVDAAPASNNMASAIHIRGTIESLANNVLTVQTVSGAKRIQLPPKTGVAAIIPSDRSQIHPGSFVGIASVSEANGGQSAAEVVVFPEKMRGTGEGSYPWDLPGHSGFHSKMTNGTVAPRQAVKSRMTNGTISQTSTSTSVNIAYKSGGAIGSQTITIPANAPIVTFEPGTISELTPGAHVFVIAKPGADGLPTALRVLVGKNGLVPPM